VWMRTPHRNYPWPQSGGAIGISFAVTHTGSIWLWVNGEPADELTHTCASGWRWARS